jgi:hypothetical protein
MAERLGFMGLIYSGQFVVGSFDPRQGRLVAAQMFQHRFLMRRLFGGRVSAPRGSPRPNRSGGRLRCASIGVSSW